MTSKTLTISAPEEMLQFLEENPSISASKIFQGAIQNILDSLKNNPQVMALLKENDLIKRSKERLYRELQMRDKFLVEKGLWEQYVRENPI